MFSTHEQQIKRESLHEFFVKTVSTTLISNKFAKRNREV